MSRKVIELVQVLVDRIEKNGYQQRAREDDIADVYRRLNEAEGQAKHWKQARQEAHEAGELMRAEIETLREQLANAQRELSEQSMVANVELQQETAAWQQQVDSANSARSACLAAEVGYLRRRLDEERSVSAGLRQQLDAANAAVTLQRAGIERQSVCIGKVRAAQNNYQWPASWNEITAALAELDGEPTPATEPTTCPECERLQAFVDLSRRNLGPSISYADVDRLRAGLAELDAGAEPTPVAEPVDAEGGQ